VTSPAPIATAVRVLTHHRATLTELSTDPNDRFRHGLRRGLEALGHLDEALAKPFEPDRLATDLHHQRVRLVQLADAERACPWFTAGIAWGLYALERVARALRGITDPGQLGLTTPPAAPLPPRRAPRRRSPHDAA
jgi:hypothetical protein